MKRVTIIGLLLCLASCAEQPSNGRDTRNWLNLQKSGAVASNETPALAGEAADKAYKRYVDSFGRPLPERLSRDSFAGQNGGGGGEQK